MNRKRRRLGYLIAAGLFASGCADITPIEDGREYGAVITLKDWFTSSYLLPYSEGAVLFDAGFRVGKMEKLLEDHGVSPQSVTHVFITHGHGDHIGALELFSEAQIVAMETERDLVQAESEGRFTLDLGLAGGEVFTFDEVVVEAIAVPGHTAGNAVYRVDGTVLLGDSALLNRSGELQPVAEKRSDDPDLAAASLANLATVLAEAEIDWLVPAHSAGVSGLEALEQYADAQ